MTTPENTIPPSLPQEGRVYRLPYGDRRSAIYVMIGFCGFAVILFYFDLIMEQAGRPLPNPNQSIQFIATSLCLLFGLAMIVPLRWRLIANQNGITRHRLLSRDLWTWSDFASGRIQKIYPWKFRDPQRRWWSRKLDLGHLDIEEARELTRLINEVYKLLPLPELPKAIAFKYFWRNKFILDENGIHASIRGRKHDWLWKDIRRLRILQNQLLRRDFQELQLFAQGETIQLKMHGLNPSWRGAKSEVVYEFLRLHLPLEKIDFDIADEKPSRAEDVQRELMEFKKEQQGMRFIYGGLGCMTVALLLVYCLWKRDFWAASVFAFGILPFSPVFWWVHKSRAALRERLESWLAEMQTEADS